MSPPTCNTKGKGCVFTTASFFLISSISFVLSMTHGFTYFWLTLKNFLFSYKINGCIFPYGGIKIFFVVSLYMFKGQGVECHASFSV